MISILLFYRIVQFFAVLIMGFVLVKTRIVKPTDSVVLSRISLYLLIPAAIINAFDIEMTGEIMQGLILAFAVSIGMHFVILGLDLLYKKLFRASCVERASVAYSNAANLIIPIVGYVLGEEWVVYSTAYMTVQLVFIWTHGVKLFEPKQKTSMKKILLNPTIIAICIGVMMLTLGLRLPKGVYRREL